MHIERKKIPNWRNEKQNFIHFILSSERTSFVIEFCVLLRIYSFDIPFKKKKSFARVCLLCDSIFIEWFRRRRRRTKMDRFVQYIV